jgi:hypothetical protein
VAQKSATASAHLAELPGRRDDKEEPVADILPHIWSKLAVNCAINPLCALTGLLPGQLQQITEVRELQAGIASEIEGLCADRGIVLPEKDLIGSIWTKSKGGIKKPSMVQHLAVRGQTEIDPLNGAVARMAREAGRTTCLRQRSDHRAHQGVGSPSAGHVDMPADQIRDWFAFV